MASTGKPKVLMIAFGHPDNVLSLCKNITDVVNVSLVFVMSGSRFQQGILDVDISNLNFGLNTKENSLKIFPKVIQNYIGSNFNLRIIRTPNRKILRDKYFKNLRSIIKAALALRKENYDVVHFNGVSGFMYYFLISFGIKKKIWTLHDFLPHSGEENKKSFMVQKLLAKFDFHFIQHYKYLQKELTKEYKLQASKVFQVYSGRLDVFNVFEPKPINIDAKYLLFFGRISKYKGIDFLIDAFNNLSIIDNVKLVIAGKGELWFDKSVLNSNPNIVFINRYIETEELICLIKNSLFIVIPYSDATHSAAVVTSYAFDKPVIATNVGGISEVVIDKKTGILVNPGDIQNLKSAIEKLINEEKLRTEFESNIICYCNESEFSWNFIKNKMVNIYSTF